MHVYCILTNTKITACGVIFYFRSNFKLIQPKIAGTANKAQTVYKNSIHAGMQKQTFSLMLQTCFIEYIYVILTTVFSR